MVDSKEYRVTSRGFETLFLLLLLRALSRRNVGGVVLRENESRKVEKEEIDVIGGRTSSEKVLVLESREPNDPSSSSLDDLRRAVKLFSTTRLRREGSSYR